MNPARLNLPVLRQVPEAQVRILSHAPYYRMASALRSGWIGEIVRAVHHAEKPHHGGHR